MLKPGTEAFILDPLNFPELLGPLVSRVRNFPGSSEQFTRDAIGRLIAGDPRVMVIVVTNNRKLVGHAVYELVGSLVLVHQCLVDHGYPRAIDISLELVDTWAMQKGASLYRMEVSEHDAEIWTGKYKRYGFTVKSYNVERPIK